MSETQASGPCVFCGSTMVRKKLCLSGRTYLKCAKCKTLRRHPASEPTERTRYYQSEYGEAFLSSLESPERKAMLKKLLRSFGPAQGRRLLDIGAGSGLLVKLACEAGWRAEGTELSAHNRAWALSRYGVTLRDPTTHPPPSNHFDRVTLINVLNQAPEPKALILEAGTWLVPGGHLLIRVPNADFHVPLHRAAERFGFEGLKKWAVLHDYLLSASSLRSVLSLAGLRVLKVRLAPLAGGGGMGTGLGYFYGPAKACVAVAFRALSLVSRARLLWGPSLEAEAALDKQFRAQAQQPFHDV